MEKSKTLLNLRVVSLAKWAVLGKVVLTQLYTVLTQLKIIWRGAGISVFRTLKVPAYSFCLTIPF